MRVVVAHWLAVILVLGGLGPGLGSAASAQTPALSPEIVAEARVTVRCFAYLSNALDLMLAEDGPREASFAKEIEDFLAAHGVQSRRIVRWRDQHGI